MSEVVRKLIKETWMFIGTIVIKEAMKELNKEEQVQYVDALNRLEYDQDFAKEFGIGN
jgi:hypothetical protein